MVGTGSHSRSVESCTVTLERAISAAAEQGAGADRLQRGERGSFSRLSCRQARTAIVGGSSA